MSNSPTLTRVRPDSASLSANDEQPATHPSALWRATTVTAIEAAEEATYWRDHYRSRPYAGLGANHDDFGPAYAYALHAYRQHAGRPFVSLAEALAADWPAHCGCSRLSWNHACPAVQDAWERLHAR